MTTKAAQANKMPKGLSLTRVPQRGSARNEWAKAVKRLGLSPAKLISQKGRLTEADRSRLRANAQR